MSTCAATRGWHVKLYAAGCCEYTAELFFSLFFFKNFFKTFTAKKVNTMFPVTFSPDLCRWVTVHGVTWQPLTSVRQLQDNRYTTASVCVLWHVNVHLVLSVNVGATSAILGSDLTLCVCACACVNRRLQETGHLACNFSLSLSRPALSKALGSVCSFTHDALCLWLSPLWRQLWANGHWHR